MSNQNRIDNNHNNITIAKDIVEEDFYDILVDSYTSYASLVIRTRAIPGLDGCKIVQLRALYNMFITGNTYNNRFRKCARIIGDISGKFHPHGELSIYEAIVRMAQSFSSYVPLIESQGNFGSADGDSAAAPRYTEARLSKVGTYVLGDLNYDILPKQKNYDASLEEPIRLTLKAPMLMINGSYGIAVSFTTFIPSHRPAEIISLIKYLVANNHIRRYIKYHDIQYLLTGPDFKIYCIINDTYLEQIYSVGSGPLLTSCELVFNVQHNAIDIFGLPYNVKKTKLIDSIVDAIKKQIINHVIDMVDYTKDETYHLRIFFNSNISVNNYKTVVRRLLKYTMCSNTVGCNLRIIVDGKPVLLPIVDIANCFIDDRFKHIKLRILEKIRTSLLQMEKILALFIAFSTQKVIDIIKTIMNETSIDYARSQLAEMVFDISHISYLLPARIKKLNLQRFSLTSLQIEYLLNTAIKRLNPEKLEEVILSIKKYAHDIRENEDILVSEYKIYNIIIDELNDFLKLNSEISSGQRICKIKTLKLSGHRHLLEDEVELVVAINNVNELVWKKIEDIQLQKRGGKGKTIHSELKVASYCSSHDELLLVDIMGKIFSINMFDCFYIGSAIEHIKHINIVYAFHKRKILDYKYMLILTKQGLIKKHLVDKIQNVYKSGKYICNLDEQDMIQKVIFFNDNDHISIFTRLGRSITLEVDKLHVLTNIRTRGCKGIKLKENDEVVDAVAYNNDMLYLIIIGKNGYAKKINISDINIANRNTIGNKFINTRYGEIIAITSLYDDSKILLITKKGHMILFNTSTIPTLHRYAKGVKLLDIANDDVIINTIVL